MIEGGQQDGTCSHRLYPQCYRRIVAIESQNEYPPVINVYTAGNENFPFSASRSALSASTTALPLGTWRRPTSVRADRAEFGPKSVCVQVCVPLGNGAHNGISSSSDLEIAPSGR